MRPCVKCGVSGHYAKTCGQGVVRTGAERVNDLRQRRREAGLCLECGADGNGKTICADCKARREAKTEQRDTERRARERGPLPAVVDGHARPRCRAECPEGPCPWIGCRYHMAVVRVTSAGRLVLAVDEDSVLEMEETCALRAAESGAHQYDEIAKRLGLAEEYVEEIAFFALAKLGRARDLTDAGLVVESELATARAKRVQQEARNRARSNSSRAERDRMGGST